MSTRSTLEPDTGDPLATLRGALAVVPSPEFAARVRERVRFEAMRGPSLRWWRPALVGAATVALLVTAVRWTAGPDRGPVAGGAERARATTAVERPLRPPPTLAPAPPTSVPDRAGVAASTASSRRAAPVAARRTAGVRSSQPDAWPEMPVLVSADERRALDRLLLAIRAGRASVPPPLRPVLDEAGRVLEPPAIDIPLLAPVAPLTIGILDDTRRRDR